jgi:hypothetical protein
MKDVSVSFTPEDLIQNMTSIGHIKTTNTNPHSPVNFQTGKIKVLFTIDLGAVKPGVYLL